MNYVEFIEKIKEITEIGQAIHHLKCSKHPVALKFVTKLEKVLKDETETILPNINMLTEEISNLFLNCSVVFHALADSMKKQVEKGE